MRTNKHMHTNIHMHARTCKHMRTHLLLLHKVPEAIACKDEVLAVLIKVNLRNVRQRRHAVLELLIAKGTAMQTKPRNGKTAHT